MLESLMSTRPLVATDIRLVPDHGHPRTTRVPARQPVLPSYFLITLSNTSTHATERVEREEAI